MNQRLAGKESEQSGSVAVLGASGGRLWDIRTRANPAASIFREAQSGGRSTYLATGVGAKNTGKRKIKFYHGEETP